jgi:hypothetical protein
VSQRAFLGIKTALPFAILTTGDYIVFTCEEQTVLLTRTNLNDVFFKDIKGFHPERQV